MSEQAKEQQAKGDSAQETRSGVINAVETPLGFFVLIVLVVEVVFGVSASMSAGTDRTYLILGMLITIFSLILIVAGMALFRPQSLYGKTTNARPAATQTKVEQSNLQSLAEGNRNSKVRLQTRDEHRESLVNDAKTAKHFVHETFLNQPRYTLSELEAEKDLDVSTFGGYLSGKGLYPRYHRVLFERMSKGEITFGGIHIISHRRSLKSVLFKLLLFDELPYFVRYFEVAQTRVPTIDLTSFDNSKVYIGGFYSASDSVNAKVLLSEDLAINEWFEDYFRTLWQDAIPLQDDGGNIRWKQVKELAISLGFDEETLDKLVTDLRRVVKEVRMEAGLGQKI